MTKANNDNEPLTFITLGALTANVVEYLKMNAKQDEPSSRDPNGSGTRQHDDGNDRCKVDHHLRKGSAVGR